MTIQNHKMKLSREMNDKNYNIFTIRHKLIHRHDVGGAGIHIKHNL